jgi:hypothetical protein
MFLITIRKRNKAIFPPHIISYHPVEKKAATLD